MKAPAGLPAKPARDQRLDAVKGVLQLSIFAKHVGLSFVGGWVIHSNWGFSDSSELFLLLSGFTLGSVFALKQAKGGWAAAAWDMLARAVRLYRTHLLVFALFGLMVGVACHPVLPGEAERLGWMPVFTMPLDVLPGILLMLHQPAFMGILPSFVWGMLLLPGFAWLWGRVGERAILLPLGVYALVQVTGWHVPGWGMAGVEFDPLAWQVLFLGGAWLGRRALLRGRALGLPPVWDRAVTAVAAAVLVVGVATRVALYGAEPAFALWAAPFAMPAWLVEKAGLPLPALVHALSLAWLVARFVPRDAAWMRGAVGEWLAAIGRKSLEVFCLGLFLSWGATHLLALAPASWVVDLGLTAGGMAALGVWARWLGQGGWRAMPARRAAGARVP
ncbi:MAG: OpgC domain-containing protein [Cyanobacteria bacterium REEB498]|nr:OpgC domain-containing protein [Cyanobacteria bacterium REEB498]